MTTTAYAASEPFVITTCPDHGTRETRDFATMRALLPMVTMCATEPPHADEHAAYGEECWACCPSMVIDPYGLLDY